MRHYWTVAWSDRSVTQWQHYSDDARWKPIEGETRACMTSDSS